MQAYLSSYGRASVANLVAVDPRAVWVAQGWMFTNEDFWTKDRVGFVLQSVSLGRLLMLDVDSATQPQYGR